MAMDDFVEAFRLNPETANNLFNAKNNYKKAKSSAIALIGILYVIAIIGAILGIDEGHQLSIYFTYFIGFGGLILLGVLGLGLIFYLDSKTSEHSNEELIYHFLAIAVQEYTRDGTDSQTVKDAFENVLHLLEKHKNRAFTKKKEEQIKRFFRASINRDVDEQSLSKFEEFYNEFLADLLIEEEYDIDELVLDLEPADQVVKSGVIANSITSMKNIVTRTGPESFGIFVAVIIGALFYYLINLEAALSSVVIILTIILVLKT